MFRLALRVSEDSARFDFFFSVLTLPKAALQTRHPYFPQTRSFVGHIAAWFHSLGESRALLAVSPSFLIEAGTSHKAEEMLAYQSETAKTGSALILRTPIKGQRI